MIIFTVRFKSDIQSWVPNDWEVAPSTSTPAPDDIMSAVKNIIKNNNIRHNDIKVFKKLLKDITSITDNYIVLKPVVSLSHLHGTCSNRNRHSQEQGTGGGNRCPCPLHRRSCPRYMSRADDALETLNSFIEVCTFPKQELASKRYQQCTF